MAPRRTFGELGSNKAAVWQNRRSSRFSVQPRQVLAEGGIVPGTKMRMGLSPDIDRDARVGAKIADQMAEALPLQSAWPADGANEPPAKNWKPTSAPAAERAIGFPTLLRALRTAAAQLLGRRAEGAEAAAAACDGGGGAEARSSPGPPFFVDCAAPGPPYTFTYVNSRSADPYVPAAGRCRRSRWGCRAAAPLYLNEAARG